MTRRTNATVYRTYASSRTYHGVFTTHLVPSIYTRREETLLRHYSTSARQVDCGESHREIAYRCRMTKSFMNN